MPDTVGDKIMDAIRRTVEDALEDSSNFDMVFLAKHFFEFDGWGQAEFFNVLARLAAKHPHRQIRWEYINEDLTSQARMMLRGAAIHLREPIDA